MGVVGARVTNLDDQTATTVIIYVKTRRLVYSQLGCTKLGPFPVDSKHSVRKVDQEKEGEVYFPAYYQIAESRRGTGHDLSGH
jgi:hypothetical protein